VTQPQPMPDGRRLRWAGHRAERRAAFVRAGAAAVDQHGPAASAEQIAAVAGVSRTVLYRYFRDTDDLRHAIATEIVGGLTARVLPQLALGPDATPHRLITSAVATIIGWFDEHPNFYAFLRDQRNELGAVEAALAERVATLLQSLTQVFGLDGDQAEPVAYGLVGYVESSCAWWLPRRHAPGAMTRERFTTSVGQALWHLLEGVARANGVVIGYDDPLPSSERGRND
jgi:AcrR family transcriptional regulator